MNLYEIDAAILNCVDLETGEIIDEDALDALSIERDKKIENIACWIKNLKSDADQLKAEKERFAERQRMAENKAESLKRYLLGYLDGQKFKSTKASISYRKSESVLIENIDILPHWALVFKEPVPDKTEIKNRIKAGEEVSGAVLVQNQNILIK